VHTITLETDNKNKQESDLATDQETIDLNEVDLWKNRALEECRRIMEGFSPYFRNYRWKLNEN